MAESHYHLTKDDLIAHLRKQVGLLTEMGEKFDQGEDDARDMWAMPMAAVIRTLVSDTSKKSKSVLSQLKMKDRLRYFDTALPIVPTNLANTPGLFGWRVRFGTSEQSIRAEARCTMGAMAAPPPPRWRTFNEWWTEPVTKDDRGNLFARQEYVDHVANKEGGTHVQATLPERYAAISRENSLGVVFESQGRVEVPANPMLAGVRQIAYELEMTVRKQLSHWVGPPPKV